MENQQPHPFVQAFDSIAAAAFYNITINREASDSPELPRWFDSVPCHVRYPITKLRVPKIFGPSHAKETCEKIKARGNDYYKQGDHWEALWKYEHALYISRSFPELKDDAAALHSNMAAVCLKLGIDQRLDLLDQAQFPPNVALWFVYTQQHASVAINLNPPPHILCKAYFRRGESFKEILKIPELQQSIEAMSMYLPHNSISASSETYVQVICDYLHCVELQEFADPKIFCEIVMLAVTYGHVRLLPPLLEFHVRHHLPTQILQEMLRREDTQTDHLCYLLLKQEIQSNYEPHFNGSKISVETLLVRRLGDVPVFEKLCQCGMKVGKEDFALAKLLYQKKAIDKKVYEFIMSKQEDSPEEKFFKLKQEGNDLFSKGSYEQALGLYYKALNYCAKHKMESERAVIRANCAQACLKLQLYRDAYSHADQCLLLDPKSHKGYFRRAEALRAMLDSPQKLKHPPGRYDNVVKDYLKSHTHQANVETFCMAITLTIDKDLDHDLIPRLQLNDVHSGFSDKILLFILTLDDITDKHINFLLFEWPRKIAKPYNAVQVKIVEVAKRIKSPRIYDRLFSLGMKVTDDLIGPIIHLLGNDCAPALQMILLRIGAQGPSPTLQNSLDRGCAQAMASHKRNLGMVLKNHGASLERNEFRASDGIRSRSYRSEMMEEFEGMDPREAVASLNKEARALFKAGEYSRAIDRYHQALGISEHEQLPQLEVAKTLANLSLAYIKNRGYTEAYKMASECIALDPSYHKAYFRRADALKKLLDYSLNRRRLIKIPMDMLMKYGEVVEDICRGNLIEPNHKAFTDAVLIAVKCNHQSKIRLPIQVTKEFCTNVLVEMVSRADCEPRDVHFLVCTLWSLQDFSAYKVSLKHVLSEIGVTEVTTIQRLVELDMQVEKVDVSTAIDVLKPDDFKQLQTFKYITSKCPKEDLYVLCTKSFQAKKIPFVFSFVESGAKTPGEGVELLEYALKIEDYIIGMDLVRAMSAKTVKKINLGELMGLNLIKAPKIIKLLVECGADPNGLGRKSPLVVVLSMEQLPIVKRCEVACLLLTLGADCNHLCRMKRGSTTPLHVATELSLQADGDTSLITAVVESPTFNPKKIINDKQETPIHLVAKSHYKKEPNAVVLKALIDLGIIHLARKDKSGKRAIDYLSKKDNRTKLLEAAAKNLKLGAASQSKKKQRSKTKFVTSVKAEPEDGDPPEPNPPVIPKAPKPEFDYSKLKLQEKFDWLMKRLLSKNDGYFITIIDDTASEEIVAVSDARHSSRASPQRSLLDEEVYQTGTDSSLTTSKQLAPMAYEGVQELFQEGSDFNSLFADLGFNLEMDNLPWEVEGTDRVVKFFKDVKRNSITDRVCAARTIIALAEGRRNKHFATPVSSHKDEGPSLYEARITKAARLLWEKAITFSSKLTGLSSTSVYTQVIRIWDIVLDHDALERKIKACTEQILLSYRRGHDAAVKWTLKPEDTAVSGGVRGREKIEVPMRFLLHGTDLKKADYKFVPAASTNKDEYNITTFVSFDTISFKSMLLGTNERRDYPFKEWQREHEIIKICSKEAILLLGRSGTGKTTCCLYRLWNEFKAFWNPLSPTYNCKLPRRVLVAPIITQEEKEESEDEDSVSDTESNEIEHLSLLRQDSIKSGGSIEEYVHVPSRQSSTELTSQTADGDVPVSPEPVSETQDCVDIMPTKELVEEDLHQIFVTKNYVLCDQIKKRFFNMVAAHDFLDKHMEFENSSPPNSFSDIDNLAFPVFLTARQFYILLDNSLGDQETFFRRDPEGNLAVKISSMDYDHEDAEILLDLEDSDSEGEEDTHVSLGTPGVDQNVMKQHAEKWTEVTALYFKELVWPTISHQCQISSKDFDPLLVWIEIQSFIKGSERALRKGAPLNHAEYLELGNKMAPNFSEVRDRIFELFEKYQLYLQKLRHREFLFDECDLMHNLYKRLQSVRDVSWAFHSMYIDEVQDFTQAELAILIHCCRDPNSMLFTGDTAQSIMRGIAFRFQDLRSVYHRIHQHNSVVQIPQKPFSLTINFRSHSGILKLAGSVIDLISEFFKNSIDHLPDDEGMFPGPIPVLVESCEVDELALLLSTNKRKASAIEFGAHQAIIVQSKESKEKLPDILKGAIVLTIFEAKGLEFDDVLLYNFFTDSLVDEKGWRVISSYLEMSHHQNKIVNPSKLPGATSDPRSRPFDPKLHRSLNAELKYLYTAITRTKCNLWIYDSDLKMRLPMFSYWFKRKLVKVVSAGSSSEVEGDAVQYNIVFASNSTTEQWKAQGDNFRKKHLWDQAQLCYERAGEENKYLVKEAQAYQLIQSARQQKPSLYLDAAVLFLECDTLHHQTHYINAAALCLRHARPLKLSQAGLLYEKLGEHNKACQVYSKAKDLDSFVRIKEARKEYSSVVRTLLSKPFMSKRDALMKAREYEELGIVLEPELSASKLSYSCAKFYAERKDKETLVDVLQYMPEMERRVRFLKEAKLYDKAFAEYEFSKQYSDAYRLAAAQGWFDKGQSLAHSVGDHNEKALFILRKATSKYKHLLAKESKSDKAFSESQAIQEVGQDVIKDLQHLKDRGRKQQNVISAHATLLLGMIRADKGLCITAWKTFKLLKHKIGELEAFNQLQQLADESNRSVLEVCRLAKDVEKIFQSAKDIHNVVQQGLRFYDFRKVGQVYCTPHDQDIWIPGIIQKCQHETEKRDIDGMHRLDTKKVRRCISEHCVEFANHWVNRFKLDSKLPKSCDSFTLHKQLYNKRLLVREYSFEEVSSEALRKYIQTYMEYLDLRLILDKSIEGMIPLLLALFSPQVTRYLPQQFTEQNVTLIRKFTHTHSAFTTWIAKSTVEPAKAYPERLLIDQWLSSWRACCLVSPDAKILFTALKELEDDITTKKAKDSSFELPTGFVYKSRDSVYYHVFSMWLLSCNEIRDNCKVLWASQLAIYHFISEIASSQSVSLSVFNMVDVLSLHCTALLAILTHVKARQNRPSQLTVPVLYKSTVQLFDNMVSHKDSKWKLLQACTHEVSSQSDHSLARYYKVSRLLLIRSLEILLGTFKRAPRFSVLKFALNNFLNNDTTRHCLILTLTLFGNLIMLSPQHEIYAYHQKMLHILTRVHEKQENVPDYIGHVTSAVQRPGFVNPHEVFGLVEMLLRIKQGRTTLAKLVLKQAGKNSRVDFVPFHSQPPRMRLPPRMQHQYNQMPSHPQQSAVMAAQPQPQQVQSPPVISSVHSPLPQVQPQAAVSEPITTGPGMQPPIGMGPGMQSPIGTGPGMQPPIGMGPGMQPPIETGPGMQPPIETGHGILSPIGMEPGIQSPIGTGPVGIVPPPIGTEFDFQSPVNTEPGVQPPIGAGRITQAAQTLIPPTYPSQSSMFPAQSPYGDPAWASLFSYPDLYTMYPEPSLPYNSSYPVEGAPALPQQPVGTVPQTTPPLSFAERLPSSAVYTGTEATSEAATEDASDSVGARVVASYSIDELRKLASSNQVSVESGGFDNFEFSYEPELDATQTAGYGEEDKEAEEDGGFEQALDNHRSREPSLPPVDPELVDPSIVTSEYCSACGESFVPESNEDTEEEATSKATDLYYAHVTSRAHSLNTVLCKRFVSIIDSDEPDQLPYLQLSEQLKDLMLRCEDLRKVADRENLDKLIDNIKESEEKNEKLLSDVQDKRAWREGMQKLKGMVADMDKLLFNGERLYKELLKEVQHTTHVKDLPHAGEELDEREFEMLSENYAAESVPSQGSEAKQKIRSAAEKQESRQRKRERKERQGRGGAGGNRRK